MATGRRDRRTASAPVFLPGQLAPAVLVAAVLRAAFDEGARSEKDVIRVSGRRSESTLADALRLIIPIFSLKIKLFQREDKAVIFTKMELNRLERISVTIITVCPFISGVR